MGPFDAVAVEHDPVTIRCGKLRAEVAVEELRLSDTQELVLTRMQEDGGQTVRYQRPLGGRLSMVVLALPESLLHKVEVRGILAQHVVDVVDAVDKDERVYAIGKPGGRSTAVLIVLRCGDPLQRDAGNQPGTTAVPDEHDTADIEPVCACPELVIEHSLQSAMDILDMIRMPHCIVGRREPVVEQGYGST